MSTKTIIGIFVGTVVIIGGLIWLGQPTANTNSTQASKKSIADSLKIEETSFDFGTISMANGRVSHIFKVKNAGLEPITMSKLYTSCMCTSASLIMGSEKFGPFGMPGHGAIPSIKAIIVPDQEVEVEVVFDPNAHGPAGVGKIQRVVTLENSAGGPLELNFSAMVTP